jgi:hypothetical protein
MLPYRRRLKPLPVIVLDVVPAVAGGKIAAGRRDGAHGNGAHSPAA